MVGSECFLSCAARVRFLRLRQRLVACPRCTWMFEMRVFVPWLAEWQVDKLLFICGYHMCTSALAAAACSRWRPAFARLERGASRAMVGCSCLSYFCYNAMVRLVLAGTLAAGRLQFARCCGCSRWQSVDAASPIKQQVSLYTVLPPFYCLAI